MAVEKNHSRNENISQQIEDEVRLIEDDKLTVYNGLSFFHLNKEKYKHIHQYALLCDSVYKDKPDGYFEEISKSDEFNFEKEKWETVTLNNKSKSSKNYKIKSLRYDIWFNRELEQIVIVYRGTQELSDWFANLKYFTHLIPFVDDHYDQVMHSTEGIVEELRQRYKNAEIITTGHSLGGGLAQQAAYASKHIKKVFAFNPTPITGYYNLKLARRTVHKEGLVTFKIYEYGEILFYVRKLKGYFFGISIKDPEINVVQFNRQDRGFLKGLIAQHSMLELARQLNHILRENEEYMESHTEEEVMQRAV